MECLRGRRVVCRSVKKTLLVTATCLTLFHCAFVPVSEDGGAGGGAGGGGVDGGGAGGGSVGGGGGGDVDAGEDAGAPDAGEMDAGELDSGVPDAGPVSCFGRDGAACSLPSGLSGLCSAGSCAACTGPGDDATCSSAYGGAQLCLSGQCTSGECRLDGDCAGIGKAGQVCGLAAPNQCARCATDQQCKAASYGANSMCNVAVGLCVPSTCSAPNTTCTANPADFCCGGSCVAGNCCGNAQCDAGICLNNSCTVCAAVTNNTYYVDPVGGSDTATTGSSACSFKSIARGVQYISGVFGTAIPAGTRLVLKNDSSFGTGERFPIRVPANVTVESELAASPRRVTVPASTTGFVLASPNTTLRALLVDGQNAGSTGVRIETGSNATTTLSDFTAQNFVSAGIRVEAGAVSIGAGVVATGNGPTNGTGAGLWISGGAATIAVPAGQTATRFDQNVGNGILVTGAGQLTLTGVPDLTGYPANPNPPAVMNGTGTITANQNRLASLAMASQGANLPLSVVNGLVTWRAQGNGMNLAAGSNVAVRNSVSAGNMSNGVMISANGANGITGINLGDAPLGLNVLQGNAGAGLCLGNFFNFNLTLLAKGNRFGPRSCEVATMPITVLNTGRAGCTGGLDVGVETSFNNPQPNVRATLDACQNL